MFSVLRRIFMPSRPVSRVLVLLLASLNVHAQSPELSKSVQEFVRANAPKMILTHVRIIDGTGGPAVEDQNVVIESGKITAIEKGDDVAADKNTGSEAVQAGRLWVRELCWSPKRRGQA
jgi:hypothetical protein